MEKLLWVIKELREKCPWDKKQSLESIRWLFIEEAYELKEAIEEGNKSKIEEELGDILFLSLFGIRIAEEQKGSSLTQVLKRITQKLIERHPHVFSNKKVKDTQEVLANWESIKQKEKREFFDGVPSSLPALLQAEMIQERVRRVGFDWKDYKGPLKKVKEETEELIKEIKEKRKKKMEEEIGDILFAVVNLSRHLEINPEEALRKTNKKFMERFEKVKKELERKGKTLKKSSLEEMDAIWEKIKR